MLLTLKQGFCLHQVDRGRQGIGVHRLAVLVEELLGHVSLERLRLDRPGLVVFAQGHSGIGVPGRRVPEIPGGGHVGGQGRLALLLVVPPLSSPGCCLLVDLVRQGRNLRIDQRRQHGQVDAELRGKLLEKPVPRHRAVGVDPVAVGDLATFGNHQSLRLPEGRGDRQRQGVALGQLDLAGNIPLLAVAQSMIRLLDRLGIGDCLHDEVFATGPTKNVTHILTVGFLEFRRQYCDAGHLRDPPQHAGRVLGSFFAGRVAIRDEDHVDVLEQSGKLRRQPAGIQPAGEQPQPVQCRCVLAPLDEVPSLARLRKTDVPTLVRKEQAGRLAVTEFPLAAADREVKMSALFRAGGGRKG
ncbi:MAG: hypothetical protein ABR915_19580 [Thermoguttaceae bacterium]